MNRDRMILIDGNNLLFRMFFGMPNKIYDSKGVLIHGIVGFVGSLLKTIKEYEPNYLAVIFDSEIRSEKFEDSNYKKNRIMDYSNVPDEENPFSQLPDIKKCLRYMNISYIEKEKCEADDVIATICKTYKNAMQDIIIVSTDKDYFQLIDDKINVLCPRGKNSILYNAMKIKERFGILPNQYIYYSSLVGDKSDNIPGISGIGKMTASILINEYKDIENIYRNLKNMKPGISKKLEGNFDKVMNNIYLIKMDSKLDIDIQLEDLAIEFYKYKEMKTMAILSRAR